MKTKINYIISGIFAIWALCAGSPCFGQGRPVNKKRILDEHISDMSPKSFIFTAYPTNFAAETIKVGGEFKLSHNKGLKILASLGASNNPNAYEATFYGLQSFTEYGIEAQLRFYLLKNQLPFNGLYVAPYIGFKTMNYTEGFQYDYGSLDSIVANASRTVSNLSIGYIVGYQYIYRSSFTFDAFVGGGDNFISGDNSGGTLKSSLFAYRNGIDLHVGVGIGIAF